MSATRRTILRDIFNPEIFPVFLMYFFWAFGTGGLWLVRPLFAFETGGTFLLVALISSVSAMPRLVTGPLTGYLTDRFGRKVFVVLGSVLHIVAMVGDFFIDTYVPFLLMEIVGGIGISIWMTSASVLMADATRVETRGRALAVRETSNRIGLLTGPAVAGLIAAAFGLKYIFLFIAACKVIVIIVTVLWIRERQRAARDQAPRRATGFRLPHPDLTMFRTRAFLALSICTFALSMVAGGTGVFRTLFPPQSAEVARLDEAQIGLLIAIAGGFALVGGIPAGIASDRWGRRRLLLAGLLLTALSTFIMADMASFAGAAAAAIVFGLAEALGWGTMQAYAMDLAPEDRRGAFIGIWSLFQVLGQITGPLLIGTIADAYGFGDGFLTVTGLLLAGAAMVVVFGRATRVRAREPG